MSPEAALRRLGRFARGVRIVRPLHAGRIKQSYLIERAGERLVLRVDGAAVRALGLNRRVELQVLRAAARAGVGPAPIAWHTQAPAVLVMRYVPGRSWRASDLTDPYRLQQLGGLLRRVHAVAAPLPALDLERALARYARCAAEPEARELAAEAGRLLARLQPREEALCHHDPIAPNLVGLRRPLLIDWEYAARGDPLFDLAVISRHYALSDEQVRILLTAYGQCLSGQGLRRLAAFGALYDRVAMLWLLALQRESGVLTAGQRAMLAAIGRRLR